MDACPYCHDTGCYRDPSSGRLGTAQECNYCTSAERRARQQAREQEQARKSAHE